MCVYIYIYIICIYIYIYVFFINITYKVMVEPGSRNREPSTLDQDSHSLGNSQVVRASELQAMHSIRV